ncbi:unnamed protein product, partial [Closterium sp. NIES-53]
WVPLPCLTSPTPSSSFTLTGPSNPPTTPPLIASCVAPPPPPPINIFTPGRLASTSALSNRKLTSVATPAPLPLPPPPSLSLLLPFRFPLPSSASCPPPSSPSSSSKVNKSVKSLDLKSRFCFGSLSTRLERSCLDSWR